MSTVRRPGKLSAESDASAPGKIWCVDTHVHYHPCFDAEVFLTSAYSNLCRIGAQFVSPHRVEVAICLLDSSHSDFFSALAEGRLAGKSELSWFVQPTSVDPAILILRRADGAKLSIVAGRQLVSSENVEVLLLGCREPVDVSGLCIEELVLRFQQRYLAIIPWGFGKWLGARGRLVSDLMLQPELNFCLGDNSGRPNLWRNIRQFKQAQELGIAVLPGSDTLALRRQQMQAGSSCVVFHDHNTRVQNMAELAANLTSMSGWLGYQQKTSGLPDVVINQLGLRLSG